jgi:hypothetical protein
MSESPVLDSLLQALHYMPYVHTQLNMGAAGEFYLRYPYEEVPNNMLLFFVPTKSSINTAPNVALYNKLILLIPTVTLNELTGESVITYNSANYRTFNIVLETSNGKYMKASTNAIAPNRLCIFRFISGDTNTVVLINNAAYNNISATTLSVSGDAKFNSIPKYVPDPTEPNTFFLLVKEDDFDALVDRVAVLENKFLVGTEPPEIALAGKPEGTIYARVKE